MHNPHPASSKVHPALTVLTVLAAAGLAYRIWRATTLGLAETLTCIGTAAFVIGACATGWRLHVDKIRAEQRAERAERKAERAEWEAARQRRDETLLDGDEDKALWDSVPALGNEHDTCAFGTNVHALNQYRRWQKEAG
jgi:hypothetical protein